MKMSNAREIFDGLCRGCNAAVKQEDIDPDSLYKTWLCGRCRAELEQLPPRHKITFDKIKREIEKVTGTVKFLEEKCAVLEGFILAHGLNPQEADEEYHYARSGASNPWRGSGKDLRHGRPNGLANRLREMTAITNANAYWTRKGIKAEWELRICKPNSKLANNTPARAEGEGDCSLMPTPTMEHTINTITDYTRWWQDKPQPYRTVALGQLNHTKRRLQMILKANVKGERT